MMNRERQVASKPAQPFRASDSSHATRSSSEQARATRPSTTSASEVPNNAAEKQLELFLQNMEEKISQNPELDKKLPGGILRTLLLTLMYYERCSKVNKNTVDPLW